MFLSRKRLVKRKWLIPLIIIALLLVVFLCERDTPESTQSYNTVENVIEIYDMIIRTYEKFLTDPSYKKILNESTIIEIETELERLKTEKLWLEKERLF